MASGCEQRYGYGPVAVACAQTECVLEVPYQLEFTPIALTGRRSNLLARSWIHDLLAVARHQIPLSGSVRGPTPSSELFHKRSALAALVGRRQEPSLQRRSTCLLYALSATCRERQHSPYRQPVNIRRFVPESEGLKEPVGHGDTFPFRIIFAPTRLGSRAHAPHTQVERHAKEPAFERSFPSSQHSTGLIAHILLRST